MDQLIAEPSRRHRLLTVPASVALTLCAFLPATEGCNSPVYPITVPFAWPPHVLGVIALVLAVRRLHGVEAVRRRRIGAAMIGFLAALACAWFRLWVDAAMLVGLALSLAAAAWLAVGCLVWWRDLGAIPTVPPMRIGRSAEPTGVVVPVLAALMFATFAAVVARVPVAIERPAPTPSPSSDDSQGGWWGGC